MPYVFGVLSGPSAYEDTSRLLSLQEQLACPLGTNKVSWGGSKWVCQGPMRKDQPVCPTGHTLSIMEGCVSSLSAQPPTSLTPLASPTKTCYPGGLIGLMAVPRPGGGVTVPQRQSLQVPVDRPCPFGYTLVAPCPSGTRRAASLPGQVGQCEQIPCPEDYIRDASGQCQAPSPVNGRCPGRFLQVYPLRCSAPDGTRLVYKETCSVPVMEAPRMAGYVPPPPPACTAEQLVQGKYTGPAVPTKQTECQTGYVLVADQCVKQPPVLVPPVEIKTAGVTSWASANWKWLAALAIVGAVSYGWAKRKPVEA